MCLAPSLVTLWPALASMAGKHLLVRFFCTCVLVSICVIGGTLLFLRRSSTISTSNATGDSTVETSPWQITSPPIILTENVTNSSESNLATVSPSVDRVWWTSPSKSLYNVSDWSKQAGATWSNGFCKEFLVDTFDKSSNVCSDNNNIVCYGTQYNHYIGMCTVVNLAIKPSAVRHAFATRKSKGANNWSSISWLDNSSCEKDFKGLMSYMESADPFRSLVTATASSSSQGDCQVWVKGISFFYMGVDDHIYFKVLGWYNLHRSLLRHSNLSTFNIIRFPESTSKFWFADFERMLFPQSVAIDEFKEDRVCFERAIFVPWTFSATPFRCKMDGNLLKSQCMACNGNNLETDLLSFRRRMLSACSLSDDVNVNRKKLKFLVIERKQYIRRQGDAHGKFQRIWTNSKELIEKLKTSFPNDDISSMHGEELEICEQIQTSHNTDVLIGMHGAGLVHLWWQQEGTRSFELVPPSQRSNGAFSTLSKLLGKQHYQFNKVTERGAIVTVDIDNLIMDIKSKLNVLS